MGTLSIKEVPDLDKDKKETLILVLKSAFVTAVCIILVIIGFISAGYFFSGT
jgi:hypothetical protein